MHELLIEKHRFGKRRINIGIPKLGGLACVLVSQSVCAVENRESSSALEFRDKVWCSRPVSLRIKCASPVCPPDDPETRL